MQFAHVNVRSLLSGFNDFVTIVLENGFDIVGITETWLSNDVATEAVNIPGYSFYRRDRGSRGGGVGIYVKNTIKCQVIQFDFTLNNSFEYLWI